MELLRVAMAPQVEDLGPQKSVSYSGDSLVAFAVPKKIADKKESEPVNVSGAISLHKVAPGETIGEIAERYNVRANTIRWANEINAKDLIKVGDVLLILPIDGIQHTVAKGETLSQIAKKYKGDVDEIARYNGIESATALVVGDEIIIPGGEEKPVVTKKKTTTKTIAAKSTSAKKEAAPSSVKVKTPSGYFQKPVDGVLTQGYHGRYWAIDVGAPIGTPIYAAAGGTVITAKNSGWNGAYGNLVIISHPNGSQSLYAHMHAVNVSQGQKVSQGQHIGSVGNTGRSTGPHLHFETRNSGVNVPLWWYR